MNGKSISWLSLTLFAAGCAETGSIYLNATPGEVFRQFVREREAYCRSAPQSPGDTSCKFLEVKPWSPNKDAESRFAHSVKIPDPVTGDSGYRSGLSADEYFNLLCQREAGDFIYKVVNDVDGILELRAREKFGTHTEQHLYESEDPYGYYFNGLPGEPEFHYVGIRFGKYEFLEQPVRNDKLHPTMLVYRDATYAADAPAGAAVQRFSGFSGDMRSMKKEFDTKRRASYGYTWRGLARPHDREMGIAGGELIVLDLNTNEVLGFRRNYMQSGGLNWLGARSCPQVVEKNPINGRLESESNFGFVSKVLIPKEKLTVKTQRE